MANDWTDDPPHALANALSEAGLDWIVPDWPAPERVRAVSTTRNGRRGSIDLSPQQSNVAVARAELREFLPAEPLWLSQQHGTCVCDADATPASIPEQPLPFADASVTREAGRVCVVLSADCLPVLFTDRLGEAVGAAHAGWRGLSAGVLEATVVALRVAPENVLAWLGPAIGPRAFEVGDDVREAFCAHNSKAAASFTPRGRGKWLADLYGLARRRLASVGVTNVFGGGYCTFTESERFYSYRRGGVDAGRRMASAIWLQS